MNRTRVFCAVAATILAVVALGVWAADRPPSSYAPVVMHRRQMLLTNNSSHQIGTHVLFDPVCAARWVRTVTYSHSAGKAEAELSTPTLRWLLRGEVFPDWSERDWFRRISDSGSI